MKAIPGFPSYYIDKNGSVYHNTKKLKPTVVREGYSFVSLYKNGVKYNKRVHLLMKLAYGLKGQIVDHKNRNRSDNSLKNLRGTSKSKNSQNRSKPNTSKYPYWKEIYGKNKK